MATTDLIPSVAIDRVISAHDAALVCLREAVAKIDEAATLIETISRNTFIWSEVINCIAELRYRRDHINHPQNDARFAKLVGSGAWDFLLHESGIRSFMSARLRDDWDKQIRKAEVPEFTVENIAATFQALYADRAIMFEQGIVELFRGLSWCYRTNMPQRFGKRLIVKHATSSFGSSRLDDLNRAFHVLEGRPEPDHRSGMYAHTFSRRPPFQVDLDYFSMRVFRNANAHLCFKDMALVDRLNEIIAKHYPGALPPPGPR